MTISNSLFYDDNATALNVGFGHNWTTCLFSNMNQVEEFYRDYATSFASTMQNCVITNAGVVALNGSYYGCPTYTIAGNSFYGNTWALETTPACDVVFESNNVCTAQGIAIGVAGYQSLFGVCNSNIVAADNTFNGCQYAIQVLGNVNNSAENVYFVSNQVDNAWGIGGGYGWSTNVFVYNNVCSNVGRFDESGLQGQWFLDQSNNYNGTCLNNSGMVTNVFSYENGRFGNVMAAGGGSALALDDTQPAKVPAGAIMVISNGDVYQRSYPLYPNAGMTGTPATLGYKMTATFQWNGHAWVPQK